jgi:hypothetical protein
MRTRQEVDRVLALRAEGLSGCELARRSTGVDMTVKTLGHAGARFRPPLRPRSP